MNQAEFANIMAAMNAAYPNEKITVDAKRVKLWWKKLSDMDYRTVSRNLSKYIDTNTYPPTIADLRGRRESKFNNFAGRNYDMDRLELALLGIKQVEEIEDVKEVEG